MKTEIRQLIESLNYHFDKVHYIEKRKRNLKSLHAMLIYFSEKYKENINLIQEIYSDKRGKPLKIDYRELVACSIAAKFNKYGVFGTSYIMLEKKQYNKILRRELKRLGSLGETSALDNTKQIGRCAEVKAANNILNKTKMNNIGLIEFTTAIRPRTSEPMGRCANCVEIFGNE